MQPRPWFRLLALALGGSLLLAAGCRSGGENRPAAPAAKGEDAAVTCLPPKPDGATSDLWVGALADFIATRQVQQGCVLVRAGECLEDLPAPLVAELRRRVPAASTWSFQCGPGVTVMTLSEERASGRQTVTVGDGFSVSCRWTTRRTWYPGQGRLKSEGCAALQAR